MQPKHGLDGQFNACWYHRVKSHEIDRIRSAGISVAVIHGRGDIVAQIQHAQKLANKLHPVASMTELTGGHMVTHQNAHEVNKVLLELIRSERVHVHTPYYCNSKVLHDVHSKFQNSCWVSFCYELCLHLLTQTSCMILLLWFSFGSTFSFSSKIRINLLFV
jgi:hypothetical protein